MNTLGASITVYGLSDTGLKRPLNEDHFLVAELTHKAIAVARHTLLTASLCQPIGRSGTFLAVADGVGGYAGGELASHLAVEATAEALWSLLAADTPNSQNLCQAIEKAHRTIQQSPERVLKYPNMASTLTAIHITNDGRLLIGQIGDSRAYLFRNGILTMLTEDQTMVRHLQKTGLLSESEVANHPYRHIILQALGQDHPVQPDVRTYHFQDGDRLLLCTDGLSSYVSHTHMEAICAQMADEKTLCHGLVDEANALGGLDNVTVLIARLQVAQGQDHLSHEISGRPGVRDERDT